MPQIENSSAHEEKKDYETFLLPDNSPPYARGANNKIRSQISSNDTVKLAHAAHSYLKFPIASWERYEYISFLGAGGMGEVFKMRDPRLNRLVALKFIRSSDPDTRMRFTQEARALARIRHENICDLYEVGETHGHPYIAMQYIAGETLIDARKRLSLERKVDIIRQVAEALHAAHRIGLIHRDVKPGNIMLEHSDDALCKPYVTDFGLVRDVASDRATVSGVVMGTPSFMSPEQAKSESIDRRSDVYSLGATLYDLFTYRPPFQSATPMETIRQLIDQDPIPPRKLNPKIPKDLETIILKCLEKEPWRRYDSAHALAEDLQRFLDGEPIAAQAASWIYRFGKKVRKRPHAAAAALAGFVTILLLGGMWWNAQRKTAQQAEAIRQMERQIQIFEGNMRFSRLTPLNDGRQARTPILEWMRFIESRLSTRDAATEGPQRYALGRGCLELDDYQRARMHLEAAWADGYCTPEVATALGQTLGALYQDALASAEESNGVQHAVDLDQAYRLPAVRYLKIGRGAITDPVSQVYQNGLIAFYERRYGDAIREAIVAFTRAPWLYEAKRLEGDVFVAMGREKQIAGELRLALSNYEQAKEAYQIAMSIGESDAVLYEAETRRSLAVAKIDERLNLSPQSALDAAVSAADKAVQTNPERQEAMRARSAALRQRDAYQNTHSQRSVETYDSLENTETEKGRKEVKRNKRSDHPARIGGRSLGSPNPTR